VCLKGLQELLEDLLLGLLAGTNIGMLPSIIALPHVLNIDMAVLVEVELLEHSLHKVFSEWTHISLDRIHKLVERNEAILIHIKQVEEASAFFLAELEAEVAETLPELLYLKSSITIIIQNLEYSLQANQASCTS